MRSAAAFLLAGTCLSAVTAHAQDATWQLNPGSNNWNTGTNWSAGVVPTGTATFDQSNVTSIFFSPGLTTVENAHVQSERSRLRLQPVRLRRIPHHRRRHRQQFGERVGVQQ
jgi:hypothetical protein